MSSEKLAQAAHRTESAIGVLEVANKLLSGVQPTVEGTPFFLVWRTDAGGPELLRPEDHAAGRGLAHADTETGATRVFG